MKNKAPNSTRLYLTAILPGGFILPLLMVWGLLIANIYQGKDDSYSISHSLVSAILAAIANLGLYTVVILISYFSYYLL